MIKPLLRRVGGALVALWAVATIAFVFGRLSGKPARLLLSEAAPQEQVDQLNAQLGFDRPIIVQYLHYLWDLVRFDFGESYREMGTSSMTIALERVPASLQLAFVAFALGFFASLLVAVVIHVTGRKEIRAAFLWLGATRQAIPDFLFGLLLVLVFSVSLGWLPSLGWTGPSSMILPAATLATGQFVLFLRLIDSGLIEQSRESYVRTAYAKGESRARVVIAEMLPNALLPVMTVAGISLGIFVGGIVIVENVFAWPGIGQLMLTAVANRDFPVVQAGLLIVAATYILVNLCVDIAYGLIDPRTKEA